MVAGAAVVSVAGFFGDTQREAIVLVGVLLLLLDRAVPLPRLVASAVQVVAAASLWIYLTQWQVYPGLEDAGHPYAAVLAALAVGILAHLAWGRAGRLLGGGRQDATNQADGNVRVFNVTPQAELTALRTCRCEPPHPVRRASAGLRARARCLGRGQVSGRVTTNRHPGAWLDTAT